MINKPRIEQLSELEATLGILFENQSLLDQSLTHASFAFENKHPYKDNERLEFFGDAVLKLAISEHLFLRFPEYQEGDLTKIRAVVVSDFMLSKKALSLNLGHYILFGSNELRGGGSTRESNLANALEALFGAYYLDQKNIQVVNSFIVNLLQDVIEEALKPTVIIDGKSALQELAQKNGSSLPEYVVVTESGPDHDKTFKVSVNITLNDKHYKNSGTGKTKKEAEQEAAKKILLELGSSD